MDVNYASELDLDFISGHDHHIAKEELLKLILDKKVLIAIKDYKICGWLRYSLFWNNIPFMNMLYFLESERGKGQGRKLVEFWENEMKSKGYKKLMTSTLSDENAQHFYRKLNYIDSGCLLLPGETLEILFVKQI